MCFIISLMACAGAAMGVWRFRSKAKEDLFVNVGWSNTMKLAMPRRDAMTNVKEILCNEHCCRLMVRKPTLQGFGRGDYSGAPVPVTGSTWFDVPITIVVIYQTEPGWTTMFFKFQAAESFIMSGQEASNFHLAAAAEFDYVFKKLRSFTGDDSDDSDGADDDGNPDADASDYAALELKPDSTWQDVQTAYREACLRYHPDRLVGQPKHLVELAVREFKARGEAYQRLKERLAR